MRLITLGSGYAPTVCVSSDTVDLFVEQGFMERGGFTPMGDYGIVLPREKVVEVALAMLSAVGMTEVVMGIDGIIGAQGPL